MATVHYSEDSMSDRSETACGQTVGYLHMETEDGVTTNKALFEGEGEIDDRGDTICGDCKEALAH